MNGVNDNSWVELEAPEMPKKVNTKSKLWDKYVKEFGVRVP